MLVQKSKPNCSQGWVGLVFLSLFRARARKSSPTPCYNKRYHHSNPCVIKPVNQVPPHETVLPRRNTCICSWTENCLFGTGCHEVAVPNNQFSDSYLVSTWGMGLLSLTLLTSHDVITGLMMVFKR